MLISRFPNEGIDNYISDLEKKIRARLPKQYRNFLKKYNGGVTPETVVEVEGKLARIEGFYGLGNVEETFQFQKLMTKDVWGECLRRGMMPIAGTLRENYVAIGIRFYNHGKIFFLFTGEKEKKIRNNFVDFIDACRSRSINPIATVEERKQSMISKGKEEEISPVLIKAWQQEIAYLSQIQQEEVTI